MSFTFYPIAVEAAHVVSPRPPDGTLEAVPAKTAPYFEFEALNWPAVKLWGVVDGGQRCSLVVHGCFPYFYARPLEHQRTAVRLYADERWLRAHCRLLARHLNDVLSHDAQPGDVDARVRAVTVATLTPFYGYVRRSL